MSKLRNKLYILLFAALLNPSVGPFTLVSRWERSSQPLLCLIWITMKAAVRPLKKGSQGMHLVDEAHANSHRWPIHLHQEHDENHMPITSLTTSEAPES